MTDFSGTLYTIDSPTPGRLATMARPPGHGSLDRQMAALQASGVDVVVSLQGADERAEAGLSGEPDAVRRAGLEFRELPIRDMDVPDVAAARALVDALIGDLRAGRNVVVHCWAGIGRSSTIAAAVLIRLGAEAEQACRTVGAARGMRVPETAHQRAWLDDWAAACAADADGTPPSA
ncbi:MAG TPA: tyrosine protein phosphatase [Micromonosporaceae bacterium]|jgi:rhodanese-related sulfurtransferase